MANYLYFIGDTQTKELCVVDPAWDLEGIQNIAAQNDMQITHALITHGHPDHINVVEDLLQTTDIKVYMHKDEVPWIPGWKETAIATEHGDVISVGEQNIEVLHTPGHTLGSQCFYMQDRLISGDTLFIDGCGRTDLPGGNAETLYDTFQNVIKKLPAHTIVYPGHNYAQDAHQALSQQFQTNPYLRSMTKDQFLSLVQPGFRGL